MADHWDRNRSMVLEQSALPVKENKISSLTHTLFKKSNIGGLMEKRKIKCVKLSKIYEEEYMIA